MSDAVKRDSAGILSARDGYVLRLARAEDAEAYWRNFDPLDPDVARLTGCKPVFSRDEVVGFFMDCLEDDSRRDFLILAPDGSVVGESVINEIDPGLRCANYRVALFRPEVRGRGLGLWAVCAVRDYAFSVLKLHRLSLDVFSVNPRAERVYRAAGFRREGVLRDAVRIDGSYANDVLMSILEDEWRRIRSAAPELSLNHNADRTEGI